MTGREQTCRKVSLASAGPHFLEVYKVKTNIQKLHTVRKHPEMKAVNNFDINRS